MAGTEDVDVTGIAVALDDDVDAAVAAFDAVVLAAVGEVAVVGPGDGAGVRADLTINILCVAVEGDGGGIPFAARVGVCGAVSVVVAVLVLVLLALTVAWLFVVAIVSFVLVGVEGATAAPGTVDGDVRVTNSRSTA